MRRLVFTLALLPLAGAAHAAGDSSPAAPPPGLAPAPAPASGLSQSKFLGLLYSEIAKRTPTVSPAGPGSATASFHIDASGKVDRVTIAQASSVKHGEVVRKILTGLQGPPPPTGSFEGSQKFNFH